jgi:NAD(P)-dependent dehydrogenase (short-subunit alcohol dehydrogenase family)
MNSDSRLRKTVLLVGASRGLGYAMAEQFLKLGWNVVGTVRGRARTGLHELARRSPERIEIATVDITMPEQIAALRSRLEHSKLDMLFVNAGVTKCEIKVVVHLRFQRRIRPSCRSTVRSQITSCRSFRLL